MGTALYLIITQAIAMLNAFWVGAMWPERKVTAWPLRLVMYSVAIMALCAFTWVNTILVTFGIQAARNHNWHGKWINWVYSLPPHFATDLLSLAYLFIIIPIIGSGTVMMIWSWVAFSRRRSLGNGIGAGWNTFANLYNTVEAIRVIPQALANVGNMFSGSGSKSSKNNNAWIIVIIVFAAFVLACFETVMIIKWSARMHSNRMNAKIRDIQRYANDPANASPGTRRHGGSPSDDGYGPW